MTMHPIIEASCRDLGQRVTPPNKALHQTKRGGVPASRAVVEARFAGERRCSTHPEAFRP